MPATIPSAESLVEFDGPDDRTVLEHFLGKSQAEAYEMFGTAGHRYTEDLMWMAPQGFEFYLEPAVWYAESAHSARDWEFVSGLLTSVAHQVTHGALSPASAELASRLAEYVGQHLAKFEFGEGNDYVLGRLAEIRGGTGPR